MKFSPGDFIALGGLLLATISSVIGGVLWYANTEKKRYGLQRDFNHLLKNQEQIRDGLNIMLHEMDRRFDIIDRDIIEIKATTKLITPRDK